MFNKFSEKLVTASGGGSGIPGGTAGQALVKVDGADYNYTWATVVIGTGSGVPAGGTAGQHLAKVSAADGDVVWEDPPSVDLSNYAYLPGRSGGQVLKGGVADDETLILQGTAGESTAAADAVIVKVGLDGADTALKIRGDGAVAIGGDYDSFFSLPTSITGGTYMSSSAGDLGLISNAYDTPSGIFLSNVGSVVRIGRLFDQTENAGNIGLLEVFKDHALAGFSDNSPLIELKDSPYGSGSRDCKLISGIVDSVLRFSLYPRIPDGTDHAALYLDTSNVLSDAATFLMRLLNNGSTKFSVRCDGLLFVAGVPDYADNAAAITGGLVVGNVYRTGGDLKIVT